ncbi:MAG TPA: DUF2726 domain-containing protein [Verrucomicrobiae bacterium]|nr:DUF2726 domain-containing protein [Verrucomicrobiae bacterium]
MLGTIILVVIVIAVLLAVNGAIAKFLGQNDSRQNGRQAYEAIPAFLSSAERSFFGVLQQAVASDFQIFAKVRLADIVRPIKSSSRSGWQSAFNRITGKHVDFVLCDSKSLGVVVVVELDDRTHERFERGIRDSLVDAALRDAAIPILRVPARQNYSPMQIREMVKNIQK